MAAGLKTCKNCFVFMDVGGDAILCANCSRIPTTRWATCKQCKSQFITADVAAVWCGKCNRADSSPLSASHALHASSQPFVDCAGKTHSVENHDCWCGYPNTHYRYWLYMCIVGKQHSEHELHRSKLTDTASQCCVCGTVLHAGDVVLRCHECQVNICVACKAKIPRTNLPSYKMWELSLRIANGRHDLRRLEATARNVVVLKCDACLLAKACGYYWHCGGECEVTICPACYGEEAKTRCTVDVGTQTYETVPPLTCANCERLRLDVSDLKNTLDAVINGVKRAVAGM